MSRGNRRNGGNGFLMVIIIIIIVLLIMLGVGFGFGKGRGKGEGNGDGNSKVEAMQREAEPEQEDITEEKAKTQNLEETEEDTAFKVSVVGNEYFYDNERIELNDLLLKLDDASDDASVEVKDDNASLKAYNALLDELEDNHITYTEK